MPLTVKSFNSHDAQLEILVSRGMVVASRDEAVRHLQRVSYYRLSGYWYSFRKISDGVRTSAFFDGTTLEEVVNLYDFDARLRTITFDALAPVELAVRAALGHALGEIDECAHLKPSLLGPRANRGEEYRTWLRKYNRGLTRSHEDFVAHHRARYQGTLPVWVAVEILDWGSLRYLYGFSPRPVQNHVASLFGLTAPQFESWIKALEIVRNACAHHGRLFNRVYAKTPKLPSEGQNSALDSARDSMNRTFGQLTLIQHLRDSIGFGPSRMLIAVLKTYPELKPLPIRHVGVPSDWESSSLWSL